MTYEMKTSKGLSVSLDTSMIVVGKNDMFRVNEIAELAGKQTHHWYDNQRTKDLVEQYQLLNPDRGIPILVVKGGYSSEQGTWIHKDLGHSFLMWCFPSYELLVNKILNELFDIEYSYYIGGCYE